MITTLADQRPNLQAFQSGAVADVKTQTGLGLHIRPARPDDEAALDAFFRCVTPEDLRFRFLTGLRVVGHDRLSAMTRIDDPGTIGFLAYNIDNDSIVAAGMLAADGVGPCPEVALSVSATMKRHGISWCLLKHMLGHAKANGLKCVESIESAAHKAAIDLEREMGFESLPCPGDPSLRIERYTFDQGCGKHPVTNAPAATSVG